MVLSNSMLIPVLPAIQGALNISLFQAGLIITAFSIPAGLTIPFGGLASDYWGRKIIIVPALLLFGLGGLLAGVAPLLTDQPYHWILAGRVVQGIGGGGTYQISLALAGDIFQSGERSKVMGLLEASNGLGKVISPILGAAAALWTWFVPFFVYPLLAWSSAAAVWKVVEEPEHGEKKPRSLAKYWDDLSNIYEKRGRDLAACFAAGAVVLFMLFGVLSWYSDVLERSFGIFGFRKGFVIAIPVLVMAATSWLSGSYLQKHLTRWLHLVAVTGLGLGALGLGVLVIAKSFVSITAAVTLLGLGNGLVLPALNTLITSSAKTAERGIVTALYGTVRFFGAALGPPTFGMIIGLGAPLTFVTAAAVTAAAAVAAQLWIHQENLLPARMLGASGARDRAPKIRPKPPAIVLGDGEGDD